MQVFGDQAACGQTVLCGRCGAGDDGACEAGLSCDVEVITPCACKHTADLIDRFGVGFGVVVRETARDAHGTCTQWDADARTGTGLFGGVTAGVLCAGHGQVTTDSACDGLTDELRACQSGVAT